ncbi:MAG: ABC transporter transmembrane domain-containing protein [Acidimicrobiales bacterium]
MLKLPFDDPGTPDLRSAWRFLAWAARAQWQILATGSFFGIIWMASQAIIPLALGASLGAMVRRDRPQIVWWAVAVLGLGLLQAFAGVMRHRRAVACFLIACTRIEQIVARHAAMLGGDLARRVEAGEVANLGASDVERIADGFDVVARFAGGVVSYVLVAVILLIASPPLGAVVVLGVPVSIAAIAPIMRPFERRQTKERDLRTEASSLAADTVSGLRVLRGLGGERVFIGRYQKASDAVANASKRTADLQALLDGAQVVLPGAIVVAITWIGAHFTAEHQISSGELVAFYASAAFLVIPVQTFVEAASKWTASVVAARRVLGVLTIDREIPVDEYSSPEVAPAGVLIDEATGVRVEPGVLTVVVPATPEEGSALLDRLGRWNAPTNGAGVRWGGRPVSELPLAWYRRQVVVLERSPRQLGGSLRQALTPAFPTAGGQVAIDRALEAAQASEIVESLPDGLDTVLPEQWRSLSGGQRQRVALGRALTAGAPVLLLDDPTSAVDSHTEVAIARGLADLRRGQTTVVCTTSPLVAEHGDRVVLLSGHAVATGTHHSLMTGEPRYEAVVLRGGAT